VADSVLGRVDGARLLVDLQQVNGIVQSFSGCQLPAAIAYRVTDGLVEKFGCAFARIWLMEPERTMLKLVASSGLYSRIDGDFSRVPVGAYKVGKIAQHQIPFLSNQLAEETWVKDRHWAISHGIKGFAGYPLIVDRETIGVLAVFSQQVMVAEFLEVLQSLCTSATIALEAAIRYQRGVEQGQNAMSVGSLATGTTLSEQLKQTLKSAQLTLVGMERSLALPLHNLLLRTGEILGQRDCIYARLTYERDRLALEAVIAEPVNLKILELDFADILFESTCIGGNLEIVRQGDRSVFQCLLRIPYAVPPLGLRLRIVCRSTLLQRAFSQLAYLAGLTVVAIADPTVPLLTEDLELARSATAVLWVALPVKEASFKAIFLPKAVKARLDLSITPQQLQEAVETVTQGKIWGIEPIKTTERTILSERELEIMQGLARGFRDRDLATQLIISESTVKFHINNILAKLKAKTRFQALYLAMKQGLIE